MELDRRRAEAETVRQYIESMRRMEPPSKLPSADARKVLDRLLKNST